MRAVLVRSLLVIAAGALVLAGVLYVASTVDARPPEVLEISLTQPVADDEETALITSSIEISFSEPIDPDSAVDAVRLEPAVEGSASSSGSTLIFTPSEPFELATEYTVTVAAGIRDLAGNEMTDVPRPFVFATTGRPSLVETDPADGAVDVPVDTTISVVFSRLMDTVSVEGALTITPRVDHELRWSGEQLEIVPVEALEPGTEYTVEIGAEAADVAGVTIAEEARLTFRTVAPGLRVERVVPSDGADGISPRSPIAIVLDRALDPASLDDDLLTFDPDVPGTLELVGTADDPGTRRVLRFSPSGSLPPNTTITVTLDAGLRAADAGRLAEPMAWTFTTGAPSPTLSNQILFLSERGGVANVWAMNPDGTGQRQVSAELEPILDYAVAPNGTSLVVADGRRLIHLRADGSERRVLTDPAHLEFDPAFAPNGNRIVFARADAETGTGLGLWAWEIGSGSAEEIRLPPATAGGFRPSPDASGDDAPADVRAPRYSPDGNALAFVDTRGGVGILELPAQRLTLVGADAAAPPTWDGRSSAVLLRLRPDERPRAELAAPVAPLNSDSPTEAGVIRRSGTRLVDAEIGFEVDGVATALDGRVAWIGAGGEVRIATELFSSGESPAALDGLSIDELAFGPGDDLVVVRIAERVERIGLGTGERTRLVSGGRHLRWLP